MHLFETQKKMLDFDYKFENVLAYSRSNRDNFFFFSDAFGIFVSV